ncbi:MAG TPA: hypothetical protein V6D50_13935 [Chroococcales cyanobacterium]|jgi:hypothetical protein
MMKQIAAATLTALLGLTMAAVPILDRPSSAQTTPAPGTPEYAEFIRDLNKAKNFARQAAERENGGLGYYRAEPSMHGLASQSPYKDNGNGTWTFTFSGSRPGETTPCYESVVTVSRQDWRVNVDSNRSTCPNP